MTIVFYILLGCSIIFLIVMGIAFRHAPSDPYEKFEEQQFIENSKEDSVHVIVDDGEEDEEYDEEPDNENEEDQD